MSQTDNHTETVPLLDLKAQYAGLESEIVPALRQVCESCRFALGPKTEAFETDFARYCEAEHAVALNSGTSALHLAMRCLNVGPGDEVITVPMTFVATAWAISYVGATVVFVDIDPVTRTMDARLLEAAITPRTKAIIPVHLYGMPADMDAILEVAEAHRLPVVEDAAQAHGAIRARTSAPTERAEPWSPTIPKSPPRPGACATTVSGSATATRPWATTTGWTPSRAPCWGSN